MSEYERIMLECRYILSLNKDYNEIANKLNISKEEIYRDLNIKLPNLDSILYKRVYKVLKKKKCL